MKPDVFLSAFTVPLRLTPQFAKQNGSFLKLEAQIKKTAGQVSMIQKVIQIGKDIQNANLLQMETLLEKLTILKKRVEKLTAKMKLSEAATLTQIQSILFSQNEKQGKRVVSFYAQYSSCEQILKIFNSPDAVEEPGSLQSTPEMHIVSKNEVFEASDEEIIAESP